MEWKHTGGCVCASAQTCRCGTIFSRRTPRCGLNLAAVAPWLALFLTRRGEHGRRVEMKIHSGLHSGLEQYGAT